MNLAGANVYASVRAMFILLRGQIIARGSMRFVLVMAVLVLALFFGCAQQNMPQLTKEPVAQPSQQLPSQQSNPTGNASQTPITLSREETCGMITNADTKKWCLGTISLDASYCVKMVDMDKKDGCYSFIAMEKQQPSICGNITDTVTKLSCLSITGNDESKCNAGKSSEKDLCASAFNTFTLWKVSPASLCDSSLPEVKNKCLYSLAVFLENVSLCNKITSQESQQFCNAVVKKDYGLCSSSSRFYNMCIGDVAIAKGDVDLCVGAGLWERDDCLFLIATNRLVKPYEM